MKKIIKKIFVLLFLLLVTGCSGNYNLNINEDMSIDEELFLSIRNKEDLYQKTINIFKENGIPSDKYTVSIKGDELQIVYNEKHSTIENYILDSKIYPQLINEIQYNKSNNYIDIYISERIKQKNNYTQLNGSNLTDFDFIQVNIMNPFEVNFSNAEIVNENIYTWTIKKDDMNKKIQMQFKPSLNIFPYKQVIVGSVVIICFIIIISIIYKRYKKVQKL